MSTGGLFLVGFAVFGVALAIFFGFFTAVQLNRVRRMPVLRPDGANDATTEIPTWRFKGEEFERTWQGSRGYDGPPDPQAGENWTDRVIVPVVTPLRPSRFNDRSYWTTYLPTVGIMWVVLFIALPLLFGVFVRPTVGPISTFTPTQEQREVPANGPFVSAPSACQGQPPNSLSSDTRVRITYADDSTVFGVHPGGRVVVAYIYGKPLFSPDAPLCPVASEPSAGQMNFVASGSGTGFVYMPQPNGTVVVEVKVTATHTALFVGLAALAMLVLAIDIVLAIALRKSTNSRFR